MKRRLIGFILCSLLAFSLAGCGKANNSADSGATKADEKAEAGDEAADDSVYIVYTNDVHSYVYNDASGDKSGLRMSNVAAFVEDMKAEGKNVILVDAGDEMQGDVYGAFDEGESVIELMNACGYRVATPGNHDFDYGMGTFFNRIEEAKYPYISCNFHALVGEKDPLRASYTIDAGNKKIAFIGITTPETITSSTPTYFQDENGEYIYTINGIDSPEDMYESVQSAIDAVKDEADYVIALGHVGVGIDEKKAGISSYDVIQNVEGLDAFIDAHSHTTIEKELVKDKSGNDVVLTQTGSYLSNIGVMEISGEDITTSLVDKYDGSDEEVARLEDEIHENLMNKMGEQVAVLDTTLYINDPENPKRRLVRAREMNSGDFVADSVYWYFNVVLDMDCDVAFANGGGIRAQMEKKDVTFLDIKGVEPFGNMICLIETTGQKILDALEMGATVIGEWDDDWDIPAENGGFMQVAGIQYTIDSTIPSSVKTLGDGMFVSVDGEYRVKDVKVYNKQTGEYEDLDLEKTYTLGGINYILRNSGNGLNMFENDKLVIDYVGMDYVILGQYFSNFEKSGEYPLINTKNSPLNKFEGYKLNYENPFGAERINIIME